MTLNTTQIAVLKDALKTYPKGIDPSKWGHSCFGKSQSTYRLTYLTIQRYDIESLINYG